MLCLKYIVGEILIGIPLWLYRGTKYPMHVNRTKSSEQMIMHTRGHVTSISAVEDKIVYMGETKTEASI
jgi:hypothetical protein